MSEKTLVFGHVGSTGLDDDNGISDKARFLVAKLWLAENFGNIDEVCVEHDFIEIGRGRDFLKEDKTYSVVILHFIANLGYGETYGNLSQSEKHSDENWRKRLESSDADFIFVFSDGFSTLDVDNIGEVSGYKIEEVSINSLFRNYVYVREEK